MGQLLLYVAAALVIAAIVFGVTVMLGGGDPGLTSTEPDGQAVPLPGDRPLGEDDLIRTRFDTAFRGYRMSQVDQALQRAAYDIGYKGELIGVLEAEVIALREGRIAEADTLRRAREAALAPTVVADDAAVLTDTPATLTDAPATLTDAPAALTDTPATLTDAPAALTDAPAVLTDAPAGLTDAPAAEPAPPEPPAEDDHTNGEPAERR